VDTAGTRDTLDVVEREGVSRGDRAREVADLVLVVLDASEPLTPDDQQLLERTSTLPRLVAINKCDLVVSGFSPTITGLRVSASTGEGMADLRHAIAHALTGSDSARDSAAISNTRHIALLHAARAHLDDARTAAHGATPEEFVLADLQAARQRFDEVVGRRTPDDLLTHIFERFCIGK
jgi:tRNA modification GTPase